MLLLDALVRYPTITLLLLLCFLCLRDGRAQAATRYSAILCFVIAMLMLGTSHPVLALPESVLPFIWLLTTANLGWVWLVGQAVFTDDFKAGRTVYIGFALLIIFDISVWAQNAEAITVSSTVSAISLALYLVTSISMMLHIAWIAIKGRADDMVEGRRKFRLYFVLALSLIVLLIIISEKAIGARDPVLFNTVRVALTFPLVLAGFLWLTRVHPEHLAFERLRPAELQPVAIDPRDAALLSALEEKMQTEKIYTRPGLTIRELAEELKTPEHRLRVLINQGLGHRNFSGFLNGYRIEAVKAMMAEPENTRLPVLTMAMDVGYNSLAPFNRAFKSVTGMTPSAYRQSILINSENI